MADQAPAGSRLSEYGNILHGKDTHTWSEEVRECPLIGPDGKSHSHRMKCARCGIRRFGPFAEHGAYHYFLYENRQQEMITEYIPPCEGALDPEEAVVDEIRICGHCEGAIGTPLSRSSSRCWRGHENDPDDIRTIRFCRKKYIPL